MTATRRSPPPFASDDWMFEQQVRAELEAEAWRRLRTQLAGPPEPAPLPPPLPTVAATQPPRVRDPHHSGSAALKGLVRFAIAAFGSYLTYIAGMDSQLGNFEVWLATGTAFVVVLAISAFEPLRGAVHAMAETARWVLITGFVAGLVWVFTHMSA
ncbi:MAG: hypothetical protein JSS00_12760 [Proteobacteria bacterium]|nr:hypothetical protein [Pseudomonadota bacterium]